jgi:DNA-binding transcriptional regulator of glucitol operon
MWFWNSLIVIGILWIISSIFSFIQTIKINNAIKEYENFGHVYFGKDAGFMRTRLLIIMSIDENGYIARATRLKTTFACIPARENYFSDVISSNIKDLEKHLSNFNNRTQKALLNLISNYKKSLA